MAECQEAIDVHQSDCKKPKFNLATLHIREAQVQRLLLSKMSTRQYFFTKATDSRRVFVSDKNENPNYGREAVFFH